jgi:hypothetical protein
MLETLGILVNVTQGVFSIVAIVWIVKNWKNFGKEGE